MALLFRLTSVEMDVVETAREDALENAEVSQKDLPLKVE